MDKVLCSREPWDSILGFNRPNGSSKTWNMLEDGKLDYLHVITEDMVQGMVVKKLWNYQHFTFWDSKDNFEDIEIHEIGNKNHIYPIRVQNHEYFKRNLNTGFSCVSPKVLVDVQEGRALIIIECTSEGKYFENPGTELKVIERWRIESKLPEFSITVLHGNLVADKIAKDWGVKLNVIPISTGFYGFFKLDEKYSKRDTIVDFKPLDSQKYFLSFNRAVRIHRILLGYKLWKSNLLTSGKISLGFPHKSHNFSKVFPSNEFSHKEYEKLRSRGNILIDKPLDNNLAFDLNTELFENTFMSIITETYPDSNCIFFSEKIWKPISLGHPFLLLGNPYSLKKLKELGYKTFDRWLDESYDSEQNLIKRTNMIVSETKKISRLPVSELVRIREEMKEVLIHNKNLYLDMLELHTAPNGLTSPGAKEIVELYKNTFN